MRQPSVMVAITTKNSAATIKNCIDSVLAQSYKNFKIFVTDAFSTDDTWQILKSYGGKIKIARVKGNIATGHNYIIKRTNADIIAFTDSDCVVDKNWLKELLHGFNKKDIIAVAGICKTPKDVNRLQHLIGRELEERFKRFPRFVSRAPTMNMAVRTDIAKKVLFDEMLDVAQETDFGYKITKFGKMLYNPKAIVYHYHRATWKNFFKQQMLYTKFVPLVYLRHKEKVFGDHITTPSMIVQPFILLLALFFTILGALNYIIFLVGCLLFVILLGIYLMNALRLTTAISDIVRYIILFLFRTTAWSLGLIVGLKNLVRKK